jgi:hypothetical protein
VLPVHATQPMPVGNDSGGLGAIVGASVWMGMSSEVDALPGVVDPELRVHGITNLQISDASVLPSALRSILRRWFMRWRRSVRT